MAKNSNGIRREMMCHILRDHPNLNRAVHLRVVQRGGKIQHHMLPRIARGKGRKRYSNRGATPGTKGVGKPLEEVAKTTGGKKSKDAKKTKNVRKGKSSTAGSIQSAAQSQELSELFESKNSPMLVESSQSINRSEADMSLTQAWERVPLEGENADRTNDSQVEIFESGSCATPDVTGPGKKACEKAAFSPQSMIASSDQQSGDIGPNEN